MRPLIIGIAGGSGSGKTTIAQKVRASLAASLGSEAPAARESVIIIEHDAYYRDREDLTYEERTHLNFDHPDSLETSLLVEHLKRLRTGQAIEVPIYDFKGHRRSTSTKRVGPLPVIIVEGILVFVEERVRSLLDVKIFVDTDADIRVFRRVRRDLEQRGRTFQQVREQYYATVRPMHLQFVEPSKRWADLIVPEGGDNHIAIDLILGKLRHVLG